MKLPNYYEDPNTLHVGTCENRSYYIPYGQDLNSHATLLSGDWRFGYYPYPEAVPADFINPDLMIPLWIPSRFLPAGSATDMIIISILM